MDNKPNANCLVCGKAYHVCRDCKNANSWRFATCSPSHFQVRAIYLDYRDGLISLATARDQMGRVGKIDQDGFKPGYQKFFSELYPAITIVDTVDAVENDVNEQDVGAASVVAEVPKKKRAKKVDPTISEA